MQITRPTATHLNTGDKIRHEGKTLIIKHITRLNGMLFLTLWTCPYPLTLNPRTRVEKRTH